jgi:hypothetical protein
MPEAAAGQGPRQLASAGPLAQARRPWMERACPALRAGLSFKHDNKRALACQCPRSGPLEPGRQSWPSGQLQVEHGNLASKLQAGPVAAHGAPLALRRQARPRAD